MTFPVVSLDNLTTRQGEPRGDFGEIGLYWNYVNPMNRLCEQGANEAAQVVVKSNHEDDFVIHNILDFINLYLLPRWTW